MLRTGAMRDMTQMHGRCVRKSTNHGMTICSGDKSTRFGDVFMHHHVMVEHNSQVSHPLRVRNDVITHLYNIDWLAHFNIGSRECYHFLLVVI